MSNWSAEVLLINQGFDVVALPVFSCIGDVVQVSAVAVARILSTRLEAALPGPLATHHRNRISSDRPGSDSERRRP